MQTITFKNDTELLRAINLIQVRKNQPTTIESCTQKRANKNSRSKNKPVVKDGKPVMVKGEQKMAKTPFNEAFKGDIFSTKREYVRTNTDYGTIVNNNRKAEGIEEDFNPLALPFGEWVDGFEGLVYHYEAKNTSYFRYYQDGNANYQYSTFNLHYADGTELTEEEVKLYWEEYAPPVKKDSGRQGTKKVCKPRGPKFENIVKIVADKVAIIRDGFSNENSFNEIIGWHKEKMDGDNTL